MLSRFPLLRFIYAILDYEHIDLVLKMDSYTAIFEYTSEIPYHAYQEVLELRSTIHNTPLLIHLFSRPWLPRTHKQKILFNFRPKRSMKFACTLLVVVFFEIVRFLAQMAQQVSPNGTLDERESLLSWWPLLVE